LAPIYDQERPKQTDVLDMRLAKLFTSDSQMKQLSTTAEVLVLIA